MLKSAIYFYLLLVPLVGLKATPFHAHSSRTFEKMQTLKVTFILTESLHRLAMAYDSLEPEEGQKMVSSLAKESSINEFLGIKELSLKDKKVRIRSSLNIWLTSYPGSLVGVGDFQQMSLHPKDILKLSFDITRLAYQHANLNMPKDMQEVINNMAFGPHDMYQDNKIHDIRTSMKEICTVKKTALDQNSNAPQEYYWVRAVLKLAPYYLKTFAETFLGHYKSCESLSRDIMEIVNPHFSPLRGNPKARGQMEGLSVFIAKRFYSHSILTQSLKELRRTEKLDPLETEESAIKKVLNEQIRPSDLVNLMGVTTHNHGTEIYLMKGALELVNDKDQAISLALEIDENINHLYGLLNAHRQARAQLFKNDPKASDRIKAQRPYHYWGGAVVSCELVKKGYEVWVASLASSILGKAYEGMATADNGESIASKTEDINLHRNGAQLWAQYCN